MTDILVDANTGQFVYAVINGGQLFGNRLFVIPVKNLIFQLSNAGANGLGNIQLNFDSALLSSAPFFNSMNEIPLNSNLTQQLNSFWQNIQK
jgi:hypothetical protein